MSLPISGFTAVPNPTMLPFMALQSYFMMLLAGEAWQLGKRKISAMSNEDFNKLDIQTHLENLITRMEESIPTIEKSITNFTPLAKTLTAEMIKTLPEIAKGVGEGIGSILSGISPTAGLTQNPEITQIRYGVGQGNRGDRELYAGGQPSPYQMDVERQKERVRLAQEEKRRQEKLDAERHELERRAKIEAQVPASIRISHQRWGRVSTQTLNIGLRNEIANISKLYKELAKLPKTVSHTTSEMKNVRHNSASPRGRWRSVKTTRQIANPAIKTKQNQISTAQKKVIDIQRYLQFRKRSMPLLQALSR